MTTTATAPGIRERKKAETRSALVRAAQELVIEHGLEAVTIEQVCARADVSRRTFFNYFTSKDEAVLGLREVADFVPADAAAAFVAGGPTGRLGDDVVELARAVLAAKQLTHADADRRLELFRREPGLVRHQLVTLGLVDRHTRELVERRAAAVGVTVDPELVVVVLMALMHTTFQLWRSAGGTGAVTEFLDPARTALATVLAL